MRAFEIFDTTRRGHKACAVLEYDEARKEASIRIEPGISTDNLPFLLGMFAERGELLIGNDWAMRWISERIPPPSRQNIGEVLRANNLEEYDEIALLIAGHGRSSQDDFQIREVAPRCDYAVVQLENVVTGEEASPAAELAKLVGTQLAAARKSAGLTQAQLAERSGIAQAVISRVERGKGNPTLETLQVLARSIGTTLRIEI